MESFRFGQGIRALLSELSGLSDEEATVELVATKSHRRGDRRSHMASNAHARGLPYIARAYNVSALNLAADSNDTKI